MQYASITPDYAVAPQISPEDVPAVVAAGFGTVICNRPDDEAPAGSETADLRAALEAVGVRYVENPFDGSQMTLDHVEAQRAALEAASGPVLAYCRTGTRSTVVWALTRAGKEPADEILAACSAAGYDLPMLKQQIEALAAR